MSHLSTPPTQHQPGHDQPGHGRPGHDRPGYEELRRGFTWAGARRELAGLPGGRGLNIAHEAVDRHVAAGHGDQVALRCLEEDGLATTLSYDELRRQTNRFAHVLGGLGIARGDRVMTLLGRQPEQHVAAVGTLKAGAVYSPLSASFGPDPVRQRLRLSEARVLVTTPSLYRRKVAGLLDELPDLEHVLVTGESLDGLTTNLGVAMAAASDELEVAPTRPEEPALLHFPRGTTGRPKGVVHVHEAVVAHHATARFALDLHAEDVFWCTADPGGVTGTSYGIIAPLTHRATVVTYAGEPDPRTWYRLLEEQRVEVWCTAPTGLRMLMRHGVAGARAHDLSALRHVASVGEALDPEVVVWAREAHGLPVHDSWCQTEAGAIMVSTYPGPEVRPGSMGRPVPGVEAATLVRGEDDRALVREGRVVGAAPGQTGELALRATWPSMFRGYLGEEERYRSCFADGWYLTGDLARVDEDGWFWFVGRAGDASGPSAT